MISAKLFCLKNKLINYLPNNVSVWAGHLSEECIYLFSDDLQILENIPDIIDGFQVLKRSGIITY